MGFWGLKRDPGFKAWTVHPTQITLEFYNPPPPGVFSCRVSELLCLGFSHHTRMTNTCCLVVPRPAYHCRFLVQCQSGVVQLTNLRDTVIVDWLTVIANHAVLDAQMRIGQVTFWVNNMANEYLVFVRFLATAPIRFYHEKPMQRILTSRHAAWYHRRTGSLMHRLNKRGYHSARKEPSWGFETVSIIFFVIAILTL